MEKRSVTVEDIYLEQKDELQLILIAGHKGLHRTITESDLNRPGLLLAGYQGFFFHKRIQILGWTEVSFLRHLGPRVRIKSLKVLASYEIPAIICTHGVEVPTSLKRICNKHKIPLLYSPLDTTEFIHLLSKYLDSKLAPQTTIHGTLVDVYGVGMIITGKSGIGKTECALDLVDRGHRLVADDMVSVMKKGRNILMGTASVPSDALRFHMEIRGLGIIDISKIYGIRGTRLHKRVEIEMELLEWRENTHIERTGIEDLTTTILGVEIPLVKIPLIPGKNVSVIAEVIALNHILKLTGHDSAKIFNEELINAMKEKGNKWANLDEDIE